MQERKTLEPNRKVVDSEATSNETLADVERKEQVIDSNSPAGDELPSPDGALDERDETKDADPV
jgi:hypothetical protein